MPVKLGTVNTFANPKADKPQALKVLEESAEVFSAWQAVDKCTDYYDGYQCSMYDGGTCDARTDCSYVQALVDEIADTIQACANLAAALGVDDMREAMSECEERNRARGRL